MKHIFIFGGTGMLLKTTKWLFEEATYTRVFGRNSESIPWLVERKGKGIFLEKLDYRNSQDLKQSIQQAIQKNGPVDLVLAWIHGTAPTAIDTIIKEITGLQKQPFHLFHVKGSAHDLESMKEKPSVPEQCLYREVLLGHQIEQGRSRWLTHDEISSGVIQSIENDQMYTLIGTLSRWEDSP